jgi:hypothetical protein
MIERFKSRPTLAALAAAAITALGVGGVAVAQSGGGTADQPAQGQSAPEQQGAPENSAADRDNVQDENGKDDDGPGGHADEPGNPNAEHEVQGEE